MSSNNSITVNKIEATFQKDYLFCLVFDFIVRETATHKYYCSELLKIFTKNFSIIFGLKFV